MKRIVITSIGIVSFVLTVIFLLTKYRSFLFPQINMNMYTLLIVAGLFLPSLLAVLIVRFSSKVKKVLSLLMNVIFTISIILSLFLYALASFVPLFYSETAAIENYMMFDNRVNGIMRPVIFPEFIPSEAKSVTYRYTFYRTVTGGSSAYLEMELPIELYENEKQRVIELHGTKDRVVNEHLGIKEYIGFTPIVFSRGGGIDEIFYYCDEGLVVKYSIWDLGW